MILPLKHTRVLTCIWLVVRYSLLSVTSDAVRDLQREIQALSTCGTVAAALMSNTVSSVMDEPEVFSISF